MIDTDPSSKPQLTAYIMPRGHSPGVLIGDEFVRTFDDQPALYSGRHAVAAIEGRAMLAINARIFRLRRELVAFHAGAVALGDRAAIVVGPSASGKSTTSLALLMNDPSARPLSDEFALVNTSTGMVEAFPRLFSIRTGARRLLGLKAMDLPWDAVDPAGVLTAEWAQTARKAAFFFLVGRARTPSARPLRVSEAILFAIGSCVATMVDPNQIRLIDHVIRGLSNARLYALTIGTPEETVDLMQRLTASAEAAVA
jgi:hypothetical protein